MDKPKLTIYKTSDIIKNKDFNDDFEWNWLDLKQIQDRINWLKEEINLLMLKNPNTDVVFYSIVREAFEDVIKKESWIYLICECGHRAGLHSIATGCCTTCNCKEFKKKISEVLI